MTQRNMDIDDVETRVAHTPVSRVKAILRVKPNGSAIRVDFVAEALLVGSKGFDNARCVWRTQNTRVLELMPIKNFTSIVRNTRLHPTLRVENCKGVAVFNHPSKERESQLVTEVIIDIAWCGLCGFWQR